MAFDVSEIERISGSRTCAKLSARDRATLARVFRHSAVPARPDDKIPAPCLQACRPVPRVHKPGGRFPSPSDLPCCAPCLSDSAVDHKKEALLSRCYAAAASTAPLRKPGIRGLFQELSVVL